MSKPVCLFCGSRPCSVDATICPHCGHADPNPGIFTRINWVFVCAVQSASLIVVAAVLSHMGWAFHPTAGMAVGCIFLALAATRMFNALWYAVDPTYSIFPRTRAT
jgi:hypothetical protein